MTIGKKITQLRMQENISQEQLAEQLGVSRQSVSKWEMDQALPQIDKIVNLADIFHVSADLLLREQAQLPHSPAGTGAAHKYFGTDGFRGEANVALTSMHAYRIGRFLGWYYASSLSGNSKGGYRPRIVIGKDTRRSSYMLEYSIVAGITASGADAYMLHVITTPGVSYVARQDAFDCGIMITASHNPYYDNGIKIVNSYGEKLSDDIVSFIEAYLDGDLAALGVEGTDLPLAQKDRIGSIHDYVSGRNRYIGYLISLASNSYKNLKIGLDCANGASWNIARAVFGALGARTYIVGAEPDGLNVNSECGSTHIENLQRLVKEHHLDIGFAFDGDADRCIAVDETGKVVDGDCILYVLAKRLLARGMLNNNCVVSTVMSNSGFVASLEKEGIRCAQTNVGDKFVYECMQENDYALGGEQSGHIIIKKYATTGDGLLTAIMLAEEVCDSKRTLSSLVEAVKLYPQYTKNIRVKNKAAVLADKDVQASLEHVKKLIGAHGRALLRQSGTEPLIRIMIECEQGERCVEYAELIARVIIDKGYVEQ